MPRYTITAVASNGRRSSSRARRSFWRGSLRTATYRFGCAASHPSRHVAPRSAKRLEAQTVWQPNRTQLRLEKFLPFPDLRPHLPRTLYDDLVSVWAGGHYGSDKGAPLGQTDDLTSFGERCGRLIHDPSGTDD